MEWRFYDDSANLVKQNIDLMNGRATGALDKVQGTIDDLRDFDPGTEPNPSKNYDLPAIVIPSAVTPKEPGGLNLGTVDKWQDPGWHDVSGDAGISSDLVSSPGQFNPKTPLPTFREAPPPIDTSGEPDKVTVKEYTVPAPPPLNIGGGPDLEPLHFKESPGFTDPGFQGVRPTFTGVRPDDNFPWTDPTDSNGSYYSLVQAKIQAMLEGGTGIPVIVQQAMWDASRDRVDATGVAMIQAAVDEWSGRGWGMPPGMLVAEADVARDKAALEANGASRDVLVEATKAEVENIRVAIANGMQLETQLRQAFENMVRRSFEAAKYHLEIEEKLYNVDVALFNAKQSAYQTDAVVYRAVLEGRIAVLTAWQKELEGEISKGQLNEQRLRAYTAEIEATKTMLAAYSEQVRGIEVALSVERTKVEANGEQWRAYGTKLTARKTVFDAFESETRGKTAQVGAYEAEARAFAETVRASEVEGNLKMKFVDLKISAIRASTEQYQARLQAERENIQAQLASVQAQKEVYSADTNRYSVELQGANQARGQEIQIAEMRLRNNLAYWETTLKEYDAALARQLHRVELVLEAMKAAGQFGTALAAGAMAAIHVQAGISGAGHVSDAYSYSDQVSHKGGDRP